MSKNRSETIYRLIRGRWTPGFFDLGNHEFVVDRTRPSFADNRPDDRERGQKSAVAAAPDLRPALCCQGDWADDLENL